ncbi:integrase [Rhizobium skierniewicense]|uniref:Integrase n=1 Tax=Rhizobium skierniewicense TaxID=984260 RepID=A0A7W6G2Z0_9HYPH|nr:site-specific integrase [Rhizobium skierniewicense]MBB3946969.1 integrase [Rhizobium skierniewicense]
MSVINLDGMVACVDVDGGPRLWATLWSELWPLNLSEDVIRRRLRSAERLYEVTDELFGPGSLDRFMTHCDLEKLEVALDALFHRLRNEARSNDTNMSKTFHRSKSFISEAMASWHPKANTRDLQAALAEIDDFHKNTALGREASAAAIRSLPPIVIVELGKIFDPGSPRNPFRTFVVKFRNYLIFLILLRCGLRRSELALATTNDIISEFDRRLDRMVYRINVVETGVEDERAQRPSLKTIQSRRQIFIPEYLYKLIRRYEIEVRPPTTTPFLFVSQKRRPISTRQLNNIFEVASKALSEDAKAALAQQQLDKASCHHLRHTCAVGRMKAHHAKGTHHDEIMRMMRVYFGWDKDSEMPLHYARAYFESENAKVWDAALDASVDVLRAAGLCSSEED